MPSHKAAVRAVDGSAHWINRSLHDSLIEKITREYQPLVESARALCEQWGKGNVEAKVTALRAALKETA